MLPGCLKDPRFGVEVRSPPSPIPMHIRGPGWVGEARVARPCKEATDSGEGLWIWG